MLTWSLPSHPWKVTFPKGKYMYIYIVFQPWFFKELCQTSGGVCLLITITSKLSQNTHHYKSTHNTHVQSFIMIITIMISILVLSSSFYCVSGTFGHYPHISLESITQNIHNFKTPLKTNTYQIYINIYTYIYVILDTHRNSGLENGDSFQLCPSLTC